MSLRHMGFIYLAKANHWKFLGKEVNDQGSDLGKWIYQWLNVCGYSSDWGSHGDNDLRIGKEKSDLGVAVWVS